MNLETKRLEELRSYLMLDTPKDIDLDEITKIASLVCETPIALISLVDENRQWFKSKIGLDAEETPRNISFCTYAIEQDKIFLVENAKNDNRFKDNPLVINDPNIRFYAGQPLKSKNGYNIGTICVIDIKEKKLNEFQIEILRNLSKQVINYFELYKKNIELEKTQKVLIKSERLNSISTLASGLAHEINNPMTIINAKLYNINKKIENISDNNDLMNDLAVIKKSMDRIIKVISSLRTFAECPENEPIVEIKLIDIFKSISFMLEKKLEDANINLTIDVSDINLNCRIINLSHAFFNLIINSYESILNLNEKWIRIEACIDKINNKVNINFIDSGKGIDPNIIEKIMEPFISTKEICNMPKGFGLSVSKGIIEAQNGSLIYNNSSKNTNFLVLLPLK